MGYSDKVYFGFNYMKIKKQLKFILKYKNWKEVITHNPDGEYGNYQHKQLNHAALDCRLIIFIILVNTIVKKS